MRYWPRAREAFDKGHPTAKGLRNVAEHLDDYVVNEGDRQTGKAEPAMTERYPQTFISFAGGAYLDIGGDQLELFSTARAAVRLADMVERVRERYLTRAEREANAALRERYGLDQEA